MPDLGKATNKKYVIYVPFRDSQTGGTGFLPREVDLTDDEVAAWMRGARRPMDLVILHRSKMYQR